MLCSFQEGQVKYIVASSGFLLSDFSAGDQSAPPLAKLTEEDGLQAMAAAMLFHFPRLSAESAGPNGTGEIEPGASTRSFRGYFPEVVHCRCKGSSCCHETTIGFPI